MATTGGPRPGKVKARPEARAQRAPLRQRAGRAPVPASRAEGWAGAEAASEARVRAQALGTRRRRVGGVAVCEQSLGFSTRRRVVTPASEQDSTQLCRLQSFQGPFRGGWQGLQAGRPGQVLRHSLGHAPPPCRSRVGAWTGGACAKSCVMGVRTAYRMGRGTGEAGRQEAGRRACLTQKRAFQGAVRAAARPRPHQLVRGGGGTDVCGRAPWGGRACGRGPPSPALVALAEHTAGGGRGAQGPAPIRGTSKAPRAAACMRGARVPLWRVRAAGARACRDLSAGRRGG